MNGWSVIIASMCVYNAITTNGGYTPTKCPPFCKCKMKTGTTCKGHTHLNYVPKLPEYVRDVTFLGTDFPNITRNFLSNLTFSSITKLRFRTTNTSHITYDAFSDLTNLTTLEIAGCSKLKPDEVIQALKAVVYLNTVVFTGNNWTTIPDFLNLSDSLIGKLSLANNKLRSIRGQQFSGLRHLTHLHLDGNKLETLNTSGFESTNITHLDVANNNMHSIPCFCGPTGKPTGSYSNLNVTANRIFKFNLSSFECLSKLTKITLDQNPIRVLENNAFAFLPKLEYLSIANCGNHLKNINPYALNSSSMKKLVFSKNGFKFNNKIFSAIFSFLPNLETLDLSNNHLPPTSFQLKLMLSPLKKVRTLILRSTKLKTFLGVFQHLPSLTSLVLKGNSIHGWNDDPSAFGNVTTIKDLYLDDNNIELINKTSFPEGFLQSLKTIDLSHNKFLCSCDLVWFADLMRSNIDNFTNLRSYRCWSPPKLKGNMLKDYRPTVLECSPVDKLLEQVCIGISLTFIVTIIVVTISYRYRFYLRYWLHILGIRRMGYQRIEGDADYKYDAFVIYCHHDTHFVMDEMIPELEEKASCRLCVHTRDFDVGRFILDNITANIQLSRNVILVLSRAFLDSEWCRYELALTQTRLIQEGPGVLTVILLEEIEAGILPSSIRAILDTVTYNEWPKDETGRRGFWGRLLIALNKRLEQNVETSNKTDS